MDDEGESVACFYIASLKHHSDKLGTIVAIFPLVGFAECGIDKTDDVVAVGDIGIKHYIDGFADILIFLLGDIQLDNLNFGFRKTLESTEIRTLGDKSSTEGIVGIEATERIHMMQVAVRCYGGMVKLLFGKNLQHS